MGDDELTRVMFALKYANRLQVNKKTGDVYMHLVPGVYNKLLTHMGGDHAFKDRLHVNEHTGDMLLNLDYKPPPPMAEPKPETAPARRVFKRVYYPRFKRQIK
jgi:hypothetical protein